MNVVIMSKTQTIYKFQFKIFYFKELAKQKFTNVTPRPSFSHENDWNLENANIEYNKDLSHNN